MKLSIIMVNTNDGKFLNTSLTTLYRETKSFPFEVFLVDNASTDGSVEFVESNFPMVKIIRNGKNRGFAAANNVAMRQATGEYVLLLNPDTEILERAIEKTVEFMDGKPNIGVVGCKLVYANGTQQESVLGYETVLNTFLYASFLYMLLPKSVIVREKGFSRFDRTKASEVDWVIGAYFMIRKSLIDKIGMLDEQFWIYGEETDFCQRAKNAGYETWYIPHAVVVHHWGMLNTFTARKSVWLHLGRWLLIDKHVRGPRKFLILYLRYFGAILRIFVYTIIGCVTFNKQWFSKAYCFGVALYKMLTDFRRYDHHHVGEVAPWTNYFS
jgi:GT2 family glycosyltransferase